MLDSRYSVINVLPVIAVWLVVLTDFSVGLLSWGSCAPLLSSRFLTFSNNAVFFNLSLLVSLAEYPVSKDLSNIVGTTGSLNI